jgi:hypothetical protein
MKTNLSGKYFDVSVIARRAYRNVILVLHVYTAPSTPISCYDSEIVGVRMGWTYNTTGRP